MYTTSVGAAAGCDLLILILILILIFKVKRSKDRSLRQLLHGIAGPSWHPAHPLPTHAATSFESSIRALGAPCINGSTGIARHKKRIDPCGLNPRLPICVLASK
jgi:hypothetical protein